MVQTLIQANDCLFQIDTGSGYTDVLCFKSVTLTITTDEKEITTVGDGQYKTFDYKVLSWTVSCNGGMKIPDAVNPTLFDLIEYQLGFIEVPFRCVYIDGAGDLRYFKGRAIVRSSNIVTNASQVADGTVDMLGTGDLQRGNLLEVLVDVTFTMTGDPSAIALAKFKLIDANGEVAFQTDTLAQAVAGNLVNPFSFTAQVPSGIYSIYWQVQSNNVGNTFNTDAPPTITQGFNNGTVTYSSFGVQTYDFTAPRTVTFTLGTGTPPPTCSPAAIGSQALPDGEQFTPWSALIPISGTASFNITNVTKPSWMFINIVLISGASYVQLTGTPDATGTGIIVSFDVNNACGSDTFSETMNVNTNPTAASVVWAYGEASGSSTGFRFWVNGILFINTDVPDGGTFNVPAGSTLEVFVVGAVLATKALDVDDVTGGGNVELFNATNGNAIISYSWTASASSAYDINGEGLT